MCLGVSYISFFFHSTDTVTKAGPFFFAASSLLVCGILSAVLGYVWRHKRVAIFIAGILFIIAGNSPFPIIYAYCVLSHFSV